METPEARERVVIERHGVQFDLPTHHRFAVSRDAGTASLSTGDRGGTYELLGEEREADATVYRLGAERGSHSIGHDEPSYPFPPIQDALERYKLKYERLGGRRVDIEAWAEGSTHIDQFRRIRAAISELTPE